MRLAVAAALAFVGLVCCQSQDVNDETRRAIDDVFATPKSSDFLPGYEEVTRGPGQSLGALEKCGEGSDQGVHVCVPYYQCDGRTKTIVQDGVTDGFGVIDIRFGENACSHPLDVCCKVPEGGLDPNLPQIGDLIPPTTTTTTTPLPDIGSLTPKGPEEGTGYVQDYCGIRHPNGIDFKITGNKENEAEYGEFPWMVAIMKKNPAGPAERLLICGGSLLTPNVVLTGAHCVYKFKTSDIKIRAGEWDTQTTKERIPYQERDIQNVIIHKEFNSQTLYNDFALLILSEPVGKAENVGTICLPPQGQKITSKNCFVTGWGKDNFGKKGAYQVILKKIELPMVQHKPCQSALRTTRLGDNFILDRSFICAGGDEGKDACTGDGGGPLVCPDAQNPNRYQLAGMVAWGIGCGELSIPGVYADVAKYRSWIDQQMQRLNLDTKPYNV